MRDFATPLLMCAALLFAPSWAVAQVEFKPPTDRHALEINQLLASRLYRADTKFPDMQVTGLTYTFPVKGPFTTTLHLRAVATNTGGVAFQHKNAYLALYRGAKLRTKIPLTNIKPGGVVTLKHSVTESYFPPNGAAYHPDYIAKIDYDPSTKALSKKHVDLSFANNKLSVSQAPIAVKLEKDFRTYYRAELLKLINKYRASYGRSALKVDASLELGAQKHSEWMVTTGQFKHVTNSVAENIYEGSLDPTSCISKWKASPGHNKIMLGASFLKIGIGQKNFSITARFQ